MKLKAIMLDMDGTIADTEEIHRLAFNTAFTQHGLDWHWDVKTYSEMLHIAGGKERFMQYLKQNPVPYDNVVDFVYNLHQRKSEIYCDMLTGIKLRCGIQRLIDEAKHHQIKIAVVTSSTILNLKVLIDHALNKDVSELFDLITSSDIIHDKKPSPIAYAYTLSALNLKPEECIAIEDSYNGNVAALAANIKTIITTHAITQQHDFSGASLVVDHLGEPNQPFKTQQGCDYDQSYVDIALINKIIQ